MHALLRRVNRLSATHYHLASVSAILLACSFTAQAADTFLVDASVVASGDGLTWATAIKTIQEAVDLTGAGDTVLVTNGLYNSGGAVAPGKAAMNRVCVTNDITLHAVNGPDVTIIEGVKVGSYVRCVYIPVGTLSGFTLTNGTAISTGDFEGDGSGGAVWCGDEGVVTNCTMIGNYAHVYGGAVYGGILIDCTLKDNFASSSGGGAAYSTMTNCTLAGNYAKYGGGAAHSTLSSCTLTNNNVGNYGGGAQSCVLTDCSLLNNRGGLYGGGASGGSLTNCILSGNSARAGGGTRYSRLDSCTLIGNSSPYGGGVNDSSLINCTLTGNSASSNGGGAYESTLHNCLLEANSAEYGDGGGAWSSWMNNCSVVGNTATNNGGGAYLGTLKNCIVWGNTAGSSGNDIYSTGAPESPKYCCASDGVMQWVDGCTTTDPLFTDAANGNYRILESSLCMNRGNSADATMPYDLDGNARIINGVVDMGAYESSNAFVPPVGLETTYYVDATQADDSGTGTSWATAKKTIQAAVDLAKVEGDIVMVTNGTYNRGGMVAPSGALTNRVCAYGPITIESVNGPDVTIIEGAAGSNGSNDVDSVRGVFLDNGARLTGFTVRNGYTIETLNMDGNGGGIWVGTNAVASNCTITACLANNVGGGAYMYFGGTLNNCTLSGNVAPKNGGGAYLYYGGMMNNCTLSGNTTYITYNDGGGGGGAYLYYGGTMNNCMLNGNTSTEGLGGGSSLYSGGTMNNCTLSGNTARHVGGSALFYGGTLNNCVVWSNTALLYENDVFNTGGTVRYTCASDGVTHGTDNCITNNPMFVDAANGDFQLQASSPCVNVGDNTYAPMPYDLDGRDRIVTGIADMGAYEFNPLLDVAVGPTGQQVLGQRHPQFFWEAIENATWYHVWVNRIGEGKYASKWVQGPATAWSFDLDFSGGDYSWWIVGWNPDGYGQWSTNIDFTIPTMEPDAIGLVAPTGGGSVPEGSVAYRWEADDRATWYQLWSGVNGSAFTSSWYAASAVVSEAEAVAVVPEHLWGAYEWYVRGWGPDGMGAWSDVGTFTCGRALPVSCSDTFLIWDDSHTAAADWYHVWINDLTGGGRIKERDWWFERDISSDAGNASRQVQLTPALLPGEYEWSIRAWSSVNGMGPWSEVQVFSAP